ncbi:hypothetical protein [Streptomyces sp. NBC_01615]|uniref:hypothetical protein n=1 Tax=Streptomyces sp. NBC_01615 TaxID=2975898 RepID=UPI0038692925
MGERDSDGGNSGRRVAHPSGSASEEPALEELLAAAIRGRAHDAEAEAQAVAAFRTARDSGAHTARSRKRDDWRPREQRRTGRSLRATLAVLLTSVTLGGVAVAAIGSSSDDDSDTRGRSGPSSSAPDSSAVEPPLTSAPGSSVPGSSKADPSARPSQAQDTEAQCRAYEKVKGRGNALDATAWERLVSAAGGEEQVAAYCAGQTGKDTTSQQKANSTPSAAAGTPGSAATGAATPTPTSNPGQGKGKS